MNVAKWLLLGLAAVPLAELAAFIAVAWVLGFGPALALLVVSSFAGGWILRHAGGQHIQRLRGALRDGWGRQDFSTVRADGIGGLTLLGGLLLAIPGLITGAAGLLVLLVPLWRFFTRAGGSSPASGGDGVLDLDPAQWRRMEDNRLTERESG